jgi:hypothetical protein
MTDGLREQRRRQYLGHFAHRYAEVAQDEAAVYLATGDLSWDTLDRVTPEVSD